VARQPRLPKTDAEMQRWCARLEDEVSAWPGVTTRPMFGLLALYRAKRIFAAIPRTRSVNTPFSLLLKLDATDDDRLTAGSGPGSRWAGFEMGSADDIAPALALLARAYDKSASRARKRVGR
jgi:hypothetical protein